MTSIQQAPNAASAGTTGAALAVQSVELRRAIIETRHVFESERIAADVLNYLEAVLSSALAPTADSDEAPASGTPNTVVGKLAVVMETSAISAALAQLEATKNVLVELSETCEAIFSACNAKTASMDSADTTDADQTAQSAQLAADAEQGIADRAACVEQLTMQQVDKVENCMIGLLKGSATSSQREHARTALVAEFRALNALGIQPTGANQAEKIATAEHAAVNQADRGAVASLAILGHEVIGQADKLKLPVDLVVQLMVLKELRWVRDEKKTSATSFQTVIGSSGPVLDAPDAPHQQKNPPARSR